MIREQNRIFKRVQLISDLFIVVVSFFIGYYVRNKTPDIYPISFLTHYLYDEQIREISYYAIYIGLLPVLLVIWGGLLSYFGMYKQAGIVRIPDALLIIIKTAFAGFILFGSYIFILRMQADVSRLFVGFTFLSAAVLISIEKIVLVKIFKILSKRDTSFKSALIVFRRIVIVGTNKRAIKFVRMINDNPDWGIKVAGIIDISNEKKGETIEGHKVLGDLGLLPEIIGKDVIDEIVFIVPRRWLNKIEDVILFCESAGVKVNLAVDLFELKFLKAKMTDLKGVPLLAFESRSANLGHLFIKRVFDFILSVVGLVVLSPLFVVAIPIKLTSEGPVFFKQIRCGLNGRRFIFYKFRTMVVDAEDKLKDVLQYNEMDGPVFKMKNDPRITGIGKLLRKISIDELPQLWNVVKGDMSLVGPRPPLPREVDNYDTWQRRRLSMRPGITCLWQTSGRNIISDFKEWMRLDLEYIDNWSLGLDLKILVKTIYVVLLGIGAK